ncbi:MAG: hypothetical protein Q4F05_11315 [bacterium]|nr:hypothetical protein [bacterium]
MKRKTLKGYSVTCIGKPGTIIRHNGLLSNSRKEIIAWLESTGRKVLHCRKTKVR